MNRVDLLKKFCCPAVVRFIVLVSCSGGMALGLIASPASAQERFLDDPAEFTEQVKQLLLAETYEELEGMATQFRSSPERLPFGAKKLPAFYEAVSGKDMKLEELQERIRLLETWHEKSPSITTRIALANGLNHLCWAVRGGGFASTVTDDAVVVMNKETARCKQLLDEGADLAKRDSVQDAFLAEVHLKNGILAGYSYDEMRDHLDDCLSIDPWRGNAIQLMANYCLPRWYGKQGDLVLLAEELADQYHEQTGDYAYSSIGRFAFGMGEYHRFDDKGFDWERMKRGLYTPLRDIPHSVMTPSVIAYFARIAGDRETARDAFQKLNGRWSTVMWTHPLEYESTYLWAFDDEGPGEAEHVVDLRGSPVHGILLAGRGQAFIPIVRRSLIEAYSVKTGQFLRDESVWPSRLVDGVCDARGMEMVMVMRQSGKTHVTRGNPVERRFVSFGSKPRNETFVLAVTPEADKLAIGETDGSIRTWIGVERPDFHVMREAHSAMVKSLAFSPDGHVLASAEPERIKLWDVDSHTLRREWNANDSLFHALAWSPDGKFLASAGNQGTVRLWNPEDGTLVAEMKGNGIEETLATLAFSPDSQTLIAGTTGNKESKGGKLLIFDVGRREEVKRYSGHRLGIETVLVTPDGKRILSSGFDGTVRIWRMPDAPSVP
ncbi:MAG TPA: hypothetical protein VNQ76_22900 [Planctomicrobium sp.]|nr:hypothetical protein [Planctomicrobium sp.]